MRTRRQRKGGTKRKGGFLNAARAAVGNLRNGGGRVLQYNQILNALSDEGFRMLKGMSILSGGEDPSDPKYKHLNPIPSAAYMESVMKNRGSATSQIAAAAQSPGPQSGQDEPGGQQEPAGQEPAGQEPAGQEPAVQEPAGQEPAGQEPEPDGQAAPEAQKGGTRKNNRNRI